MKRWLSLLGLGLLVVMLLRLDWRLAATTWSQLDPVRLSVGIVIGVGVFLLLLVLRVVRFAHLVVPSRPIPHLIVLAATIRAGFLGMVTPGRLGDVSRVWMLQRCGVESQEAFAIWVYERGLDVASLLSLGLAASLTIHWNTLPWWSIVPLYLVFLFIGLLLGLPCGRLTARLGRAGASRMPGPMARFATAGSRFDDILRWRTIPVLSTVVMQLCGCLGFIAILLAVRPSCNIAGAAGSYSLSSGMAILPVSIGGIGVREAGNIGVLGLFGVSPAEALIVSLIDGFILPVVILLILMPIVRFRGQVQSEATSL